MLTVIFEKIQELIILKLLLVSTMGTLIFLSHSFFLHQYLRNRSFIVTSMMLPPIALVITTVISKNIVLSLGMIGALSIIRYRTPVKSIYELSLLFALITIGISAGVNIKYSIGLTLFIIFIGFFTKLISSLKLNIFLSDYSYDQKYIEVILKINGKFEKLTNEINIDKNLISYDEERNNDDFDTNIYLKFNNKDEAKIFKKKLTQFSSIIIKSYSFHDR